MSGEANLDRDFECLVLKYLDGISTDAENKKLNAELSSNGARVQMFVELSYQCGELRELLLTKKEQPPMSFTSRRTRQVTLEEQRQEVSQNKKGGFWRKWLSVAAALLLLLTGTYFLNVQTGRLALERSAVQVVSRTKGVKLFRDGVWGPVKNSLWLKELDKLDTREKGSIQITYKGGLKLRTSK